MALKYNDNMKEMIDYAYSKGYIDEDSKTKLKNKIELNLTSQKLQILYFVQV